MTKRNKEKVYESYEEIVHWFDNARTKNLMESEYLNLIVKSVLLDVVLAWHSFFHLDADSQRKMFNIFNMHVKRGGILAFTSGENEGEVWSDNGGQQLYYASLSTDEYEKLIHENSFKVLLHKIRDENCGEATVWVVMKI